MSDIVEAAAVEAVATNQKYLELHGKKYPLRRAVALSVIHKINEADKSNDIREYVEAAAMILNKDDRPAFVELVLGDPDDDADIITLDEFSDAVNKGLESITGRPLGK